VVTRAVELDRADLDLFETTLFDAYAVLLAWYSGGDRLRIGLPDGPEGARDVIVTVRPDTTWRTLRAGPPESVASTGATPLRYLGHAQVVPAAAATELALAWVPGSAELRVHYATALFDRASAEAIAGDLVALARAAIDDPDEPVHDTVLGIEAFQDESEVPQ